MSHIRTASPYALLNSIFEGTGAQRALRSRSTFRRVGQGPKASDTSRFLDHLYPFYQVARHDHSVRKRQAAQAGPTRAYAGKRGSARKAGPELVKRPADMTDGDLFIAKITSFWDGDAHDEQKPQTVAEAQERVRKQLSDFLEDGMLPNERKIKRLMEDHLGQQLEPLRSPETLSVYHSLPPREKFCVLHGFHSQSQTASNGSRTKIFMQKHDFWSRQRLKRVYMKLAALAYELRLLSPTDFALAERHYLVSELPPLPSGPYIHTRQARLVIAMVACRSVSITSRELCLDKVLAVEVATQLSRYLGPEPVKKISHKKTKMNIRR